MLGKPMPGGRAQLRALLQDRPELQGIVRAQSGGVGVSQPVTCRTVGGAGATGSDGPRRSYAMTA